MLGSADLLGGTVHLKPAIVFLPLFAMTAEAQSRAPAAASDSAKSVQSAQCSELIRRQLTPDRSLAQAPLAGLDSTCRFGAPPMGLNGAGTPMPAMNPQMLAAMASQMSPAQMAQVRALMSQMQAPMGEMGSQASPVTPAQPDAAGWPGMPPGMAMPNMSGFGGMEAEQPIQISSDLKKKGKAVVRHIGWEPGAGTLASSGSVAFDRAMDQVAAAMRQVGGSYRLDLYMDQQSANVVVRTLGPRRLATVQSSLAKHGMTPQLGEIRKATDPRLEIVRLP